MKGRKFEVLFYLKPFLRYRLFTRTMLEFWGFILRQEKWTVSHKNFRLKLIHLRNRLLSKYLHIQISLIFFRFRDTWYDTVFKGANHLKLFFQPKSIQPSNSANILHYRMKSQVFKCFPYLFINFFRGTLRFRTTA